MPEEEGCALARGFSRELGERQLRDTPRDGEVSCSRLVDHRGCERCGCWLAPYFEGRRDAANAHCASLFHPRRKINAVLLSDARRSMHSGAAAQWRLGGVLTGVHTSFLRGGPQ